MSLKRFIIHRREGEAGVDEVERGMVRWRMRRSGCWGRCGRSGERGGMGKNGLEITRGIIAEIRHGQRDQDNDSGSQIKSDGRWMGWSNMDVWSEKRTSGMHGMIRSKGIVDF